MENLKIDPIKNMTTGHVNVDKQLTNAGIYTNLMGITGIGGLVVLLLGVLSLFISTTIALWLIGIGFVCTVILAPIFKHLTEKAIRKAFGLVGEDFVEALDRLNDSLQEAADAMEKKHEEQKKKIADSLPKN